MKYWLKGKYKYIGEWREDGEENMWIRMKFSSSVVGGQIKSETEKKKKNQEIVAWEYYLETRISS